MFSTDDSSSIDLIYKVVPLIILPCLEGLAQGWFREKETNFANRSDRNACCMVFLKEMTIKTDAYVVADSPALGSISEDTKTFYPEKYGFISIEAGQKYAK